MCIRDRDAHYQPQVADLQANLAATERALGEKTTSLEALQLQLTQASDAAAQDAYLYEQQMRSLQEADALLAQQLTCRHAVNQRGVIRVVSTRLY